MPALTTCASFWDKDTIGVGMGLYGHDRKDLTLMLSDWGYDFIKIDWCGGEWLGLDEQTRYTEIGKIVKEICPDVVYNICRWQSYENPVMTLDILPTAVALAGSELPGDRVYDGVDIMPHLLGEKPQEPHKKLFWRLKYHGAVCRGDWKLIWFEDQAPRSGTATL